MTDEYSKVLVVLEQDIICQRKSIDTLIMPGSVLHQHDGNEMLLLLDGSVQIYTEGERRLMERGDLACVKSRAFHHVRIMDDSVYDRIVVNFKDSVVQRLSTPQTDLNRCFYQAPQGGLNIMHLDEAQMEEFGKVADRLEQALSGGAYGSDVMADACLMQLLVMVNRMTRADVPAEAERFLPELVSNIFSYVEQNLTGDLSIRALEEEFQYNGVYLSRCFRKEMGMSLQRYIIAKRCSLAQQLLSQGMKPYDACFLSGFNNYSNFARTFTRQVGISPKQYQLRNQER